MNAWPHVVSFDIAHSSPGQETSELHNTGDLAAEVAEVAFGLTDLSEAVEELLAAAPLPSPMYGVLDRALSAVVEEAARMGYALALTLQHSSGGWRAWTEAAEAFRQGSGCATEQHCGKLAREIRAATERLRKEADSTK